jgi:hypothetical protein
MVARKIAARIRRLFRMMRSVDIECLSSKALACGACRVESRTRRSGGMADAADSKTESAKTGHRSYPTENKPSPFFSVTCQ